MVRLIIFVAFFAIWIYALFDAPFWPTGAVLWAGVMALTIWTVARLVR